MADILTRDIPMAIPSRGSGAQRMIGGRSVTVIPVRTFGSPGRVACIPRVVNPIPPVLRNDGPYVTEVVPDVGVVLQPTDTISLRIIYPNGKKRAVLVAKFPTSHEVIHDGDNFAPGYATLSTFTPIDDRYVIGRDGGWPAAPTIWPLGYDLYGNET